MRTKQPEEIKYLKKLAKEMRVLGVQSYSDGKLSVVLAESQPEPPTTAKKSRQPKKSQPSTHFDPNNIDHLEAYAANLGAAR